MTNQFEKLAKENLRLEAELAIAHNVLEMADIQIAELKERVRAEFNYAEKLLKQIEELQWSR